MKRSFVVGAAALAAVVSQAKAEGSSGLSPSEKENLTAMFSAFGFTEKRQVTQKGCRVVGDVRQEDLIKAVPLLQKMDMLNSEMSQATIRSKPTKIAMAFAVQIAPIEVKNLFDDEKSIDKCAFVQNLTYADEYGNDKTIPMFSYEFDRATYSKINWEKFQSTNLIKVSKGFKFTPEVAARTADEAD